MAKYWLGMIPGGKLVNFALAGVNFQVKSEKDGRLGRVIEIEADKVSSAMMQSRIKVVRRDNWGRYRMVEPRLDKPIANAVAVSNYVYCVPWVDGCDRKTAPPSVAKMDDGAKWPPECEAPVDTNPPGGHDEEPLAILSDEDAKKLKKKPKSKKKTKRMTKKAAPKKKAPKKPRKKTKK